MRTFTVVDLPPEGEEVLDLGAGVQTVRDAFYENIQRFSNDQKRALYRQLFKYLINLEFRSGVAKELV